MIAVVLEVISASILLGSKFRVVSSTSTKTGVTLFHIKECDVATNENGVVITSPVISNACSAVVNAIVALLKSEIYFTPKYLHNSVSNC